MLNELWKSRCLPTGNYWVTLEEKNGTFQLITLCHKTIITWAFVLFTIEWKLKLEEWRKKKGFAVWFHAGSRYACAFRHEIHGSRVTWTRMENLQVTSCLVCLFVWYRHDTKNVTCLNGPSPNNSRVWDNGRTPTPSQSCLFTETCGYHTT